MHDESLEQKLRTALRTEGDQLAFTITAAELERRLVLRRRGGLSPMASLGLAAAVGVGLLGLAGVAGGWFEQRTAIVPPSPSPVATASGAPSPDPSGPVVRLLPSIEERIEAHDQALIVRAQAVGPADGPAATERPGPRSATFAPVSVSGTYTVELSCLGPDQVTVAVTRGSNPEPHTDLPFTCTGDVTGKLLDLEAGDHLGLLSDRPASWRVLVEAPAREALHAPSIDEIAVPGGDSTLLDVRSETGEPDYGPTGTGGGVWVPAEVGWVPHRDQYRVFVSCAGPQAIRYAFTGPPDEATPDVPPDVHATTQVDCDGKVHEDHVDLMIDDARIVVSASDQVAWHIVVTGDPLPIALAPNEGGWVMSSGFGPNWSSDGQSQGMTGPGAAGSGDLRVVISCAGEGTITGTIDVGKVAGQELDPFTLACNRDSGAAGTLVRTYRGAAPYAEVVYDPGEAAVWIAVTLQIRATASPAP